MLKKVKCSSVTFSRKKVFHAYVYELDGQKLELIHSHTNAPQECKHNEQMQYLNPMMEIVEGNGDSDLENLDENGRKIKISDYKIDPKHSMFKINKKGKLSERQKQSIHKLPESVRILGVFLIPNYILTIIWKL